MLICLLELIFFFFFMIRTMQKQSIILRVAVKINL